MGSRETHQTPTDDINSVLVLFGLCTNLLLVGVSVTDNASVIFGGSDEPCALGNMYSIGAIGMESNGQIQVRSADIMSYSDSLATGFDFLLFLQVLTRAPYP